MGIEVSRLYENVKLQGHSGFPHDVSTTLVNSTDPSCPTIHEDYKRDTLITKAGTTRLSFDFEHIVLVHLHFCNWN